jgi:hypothetical protein
MAICMDSRAFCLASAIAADPPVERSEMEERVSIPTDMMINKIISDKMMTKAKPLRLSDAGRVKRPDVLEFHSVAMLVRSVGFGGCFIKGLGFGKSAGGRHL